MRKKILALVFAAALLVAMAVPLFGGVGTAEAIVDPIVPADECTGEPGVGSQAGGSLLGTGEITGFPVMNNNDGNATVTATGVPEACS